MPTTLEDLPVPAHDTIASLLPDGNAYHSPNRRRLALVSRVLLGFHGHTLTHLRLHWHADNQDAALATLLERQCSLQEVHVDDRETLPSLAVVLAQGCLCNVKHLEVSVTRGVAVTLAQIRSLTSAMQVPGALDALEGLYFPSEDDSPSGMIQLLTEALTSGAAPSLCRLHLPDTTFNDDGLDALVAMVEARAARRPACRGLESVEGGGFWGGSEQSRIRLTCALLPSLTDIRIGGWWEHIFDACFVSVQPPQLKNLEIDFMENNEVPPSAEILEAMPALEILRYEVINSQLSNLRTSRPSSWP